MKNEKLYGVWKCMRQRCNNPNNKSYINYGARNIRVCEEWDSYKVFRKWALDSGYKEGLTIDRIDVNGNYSPSNCRWADRKEQAQNKTVTDWITINGKTKSLATWCREYNVPYNTVHSRIFRYGISPLTALTMKNSRIHYVTINNIPYPLFKYCKEHGISCNAVRHRIWRGETEEQAISHYL